ncbi:porin [Ralstonia sp. 25C]|uniref:porin n=1 Tax=Ralstonia sp. 25C TaxID=3447363 RepID=UPI003F7505E2
MKTTRAKFTIKPVCACVALLSAGLSMHASAQSTVTLYGTVDNAIAYSSNQGGHSNVYMNSGALAASKFGLYGTEDLGGGTQALFRLENGFAADTGAQSKANFIFNRQAYVGLTNKTYGQITMGRQYTPYFQYVAALGPTNVLTGAVGAHPGDIDAMDTTLRVPNSITYTTPTFGGFQGGLQYGMGEQAGSMSNGSAFSAALRYDYQSFAWSAGYIRLKNVPTFQSNSGDFANNAPINKGYATADSAQIIGTAARYTVGNLMMGLNYSNVQYKPGATSPAGFAQTASFNTFGAIATYALTPALTVAAGYSYTAENKRNGVDQAARYHQFTMEQVYSFSKRTALYAIEAYQKASGQTLSSTGGIVNAVASVGDSQNGTPSNGPSQFVGMVGIRHFF